MSDIIDLDAHRPHVSGAARCLACKHEFHTAAPVGTVWMECPACTLVRARFVFQFEPEEGVLRWRCGCDNDLFEVYESGVFCPNCGTTQKFP